MKFLNRAFQFIVFPSTVDLFWIISSLTLYFLYNFNLGAWPSFTGATWYFLIMILYFLSVLLFQKGQKSKELHLFYFLIGISIILFTTPLFENDHYRYIWEGKVLSNLKNPYLIPPKSELLNFISIDPSIKERIAFPELTSIYPPLSLLLFSFFSWAPFSIALKGLMFFNALLFWAFYVALKKSNSTKALHYLPFTFLFFQKEFISSIHIDLLASLLLFYPLIKKRDLAKGIYLSYWVKISGILILPFVLPLKNMRVLLVNILYIMILPLLFLLLTNLNNLETGLLVFTKHWVWNSLFYYIFEFLNVPKVWIRVLCISTFLLFYSFIFFNFKKKKFDLWDASLAIFWAQCFFSPVYNPWYTIWFLIPALMKGRILFILYAVLSCGGYTFYDTSSIGLSIALSHFLAPLCFFALRGQFLLGFERVKL
jgi:alpha-1,6-mannosyltransferase